MKLHQEQECRIPEAALRKPLRWPAPQSMAWLFAPVELSGAFQVARLRPAFRGALGGVSLTFGRNLLRDFRRDSTDCYSRNWKRNVTGSVTDERTDP
jgi:hypothetical protein